MTEERTNDSDGGDEGTPTWEDEAARPENGDEAKPEPESEAPSEATPGEGEGDEEEIERPAPEEVVQVASEFVAGLLDAMGLEGEVEGSVEDEAAFVNIVGEGMGVLIGRRGQTLDALQEITRTAVQRRFRTRVRLHVDCEAYRSRRRSSLASYAKAMAERAKHRGTEIELEPMSAFERRIVHQAVSEVPGASSFSEGEDPNRRVIIRGE